MGRPMGPQTERQRVVIVPGQRYGSLTAIDEAQAVHSGKHRFRMVKCRCDCGRETTVRLDYLRSGHTKSCGCDRKTISGKTRVTHGGTGTRLHGIWAGMLSRCRNAHNRSFKDYGAKGVKVCDEWQRFEPFRDWALNHGYRNDLTIDRINPFGNYEPSNCRWIPKSEQRLTRRDTVND